MVMTACGFLTQEIVHFCFSVIATIVVSAVFMISYILILLRSHSHAPQTEGHMNGFLFAKKEGGANHGSKRSSEKT